ncbi:zinc-binding loop region of homing endonuclease-domain-containing protein [Lipomyces kononenkoae]
MDSHPTDKITQTKATELVNSYHLMTMTLGCWESGTKPHAKGYLFVTLSYAGECIRVGLHQLALIADNRRAELKMSLGSYSFDVSHLCHNRKCFNAEHLEGVMQNGDEHLPTEAPPATHLDDTAKYNIGADRFDHITITMARELVNKYHTITTDLGCWRSNMTPTNGHPLVKLTKLNVKPNLSHLSLIANNRMAELKRALGRRGYYTIAHICHDNGCFNPQHLIVESKSDNIERRDCKGKVILVREGISYHPCVHGNVDGMHKCILGVQEVQGIRPDMQQSTEATPAPDLGDTAPLVNNVADKFDDITPARAWELVSRYHGNTTDLGCWEWSESRKTNWTKDYCRVDVRRNVTVFMHHLAVIADNRGAELNSLGTRSYHG